MPVYFVIHTCSISQPLELREPLKQERCTVSFRSTAPLSVKALLIGGACTFWSHSILFLYQWQALIIEIRLLFLFIR